MVNANNKATYTDQVILKIDGQNAPKDLMEDILQIYVEESLHRPAMFTLVIQNPYFSGKVQHPNSPEDEPERPWAHENLFAIGKSIEIAFKASTTASVEFEEEVKGSVFKGEITSLETHFTSGSQAPMIIGGYDISHRLHRGRHNRSFQNYTDTDIVKEIAQEVGITVGTIDESGTPHDYVFQENQTNMEFLRERAARNGFELFVHNGELNFCKPKVDETLELQWLTNLSSITWKNRRMLILTPHLNRRTPIPAATAIPLIAPMAGTSPCWNLAMIKTTVSKPSRKTAKKIKLKMPQPAPVPCWMAEVILPSISALSDRACWVIQISIQLSKAIATIPKTASSNGSITGEYSGYVVLKAWMPQLNRTPTNALAIIPAITPAYTDELSCSALAFFRQASTIPTTRAASTPSRRVITKVGKAALKSIFCSLSVVSCAFFACYLCQLPSFSTMHRGKSRESTDDWTNNE